MPQGDPLGYLNNTFPGMNDQRIMQLIAMLHAQNSGLPPAQVQTGDPRALSAGPEKDAPTKKQKVGKAFGSDAVLGALAGLLGGFGGDDDDERKDRERERLIAMTSGAGRNARGGATGDLLRLQALLSQRSGRTG